MPTNPPDGLDSLRLVIHPDGAIFLERAGQQFPLSAYRLTLWDVEGQETTLSAVRPPAKKLKPDR